MFWYKNVLFSPLWIKSETPPQQKKMEFKIIDLCPRFANKWPSLKPRNHNNSWRRFTTDYELCLFIEGSGGEREKNYK